LGRRPGEPARPYGLPAVGRGLPDPDLDALGVDSLKIADPLIELLAIKLYEHDHGSWPPSHNTSIGWMKCFEEDRETYREIARGNEELPDNE
jgi:hypothetical protein